MKLRWTLLSSALHYTSANMTQINAKRGSVHGTAHLVLFSCSFKAEGLPLYEGLLKLQSLADK